MTERHVHSPTAGWWPPPPVTGTAAGPTPSVDRGRVVLAGGVASLAYLAMMVVDMRLLRYPQNDLVLQGRMAPVPRRFWLPAGLVMHLGFGIALAWFYALVVHPRLPGPRWLRGVVLATVENALLWPLTPLVDRYHPAVRDGQMPPMANLRCFSQAVLRHIAYGAVLGALYRPRP